MTSLADLKTTLYSALSSGGDVAAEQELYEDLMAHKPTLVNVFNVGPRNPQEQKEIESGEPSPKLGYFSRTHRLRQDTG